MRFILSAASVVDVEVVAPTGKVVAVLARGRTSDAGVNTIPWVGDVMPGLYLLRATATTEDGASFQATRMVVIPR